MQLQSIGRTHVGRVRAHNEDSLRVDRDHNLFIVADGVGGNAAGELASALAVETVAEFFRASSADADLTWPFKPDEDDLDGSRMVVAIRLANRRVFEAATHDPATRGMSTTVAACHFVGDRVYVAHVGDSRVYRLRGGAIEQLTEDHSLLSLMRRERKMTEEEVARFPLSNVILRAVGAQPDVEAEVQSFPVKPGDLYLICSDGLSDMVKDPAIAAIVAASRGLEAMCDALIEAANENGGRDNVTALLVQTR
ncbi:MAG: Stp1/IreP family PP2C-type Ser/Thr phosphatase [Myxococcales bacterium]|nr:Stp1/IreP family PP2C-type Ser/Thr phosphatase [Myxococcales bacterium]